MALKVGELFASLSLDAKNFVGGVNNAAGSLLKIGAGVVTAKAALDALLTGVKYNAELETLTTSFEVMSGSAEVAAETVNRLKAAGAATPYDTAGLAKVAQLMMQYGFTAQDAVEQTLMLGDIAQGNSQYLMSIATGYAQMSSAAKVSLQDVKQMINGGFNPLEEISESTGESIESLYNRISAGTMDVLEITASIMRATSEGGRYFGSSEKQAKTLNGQISTLKENWKALLGEMTKGINRIGENWALPELNSMLVDMTTALESGGVGAAFVELGAHLGTALLDGFYEAVEGLQGNPLVKKYLLGFEKYAPFSGVDFNNLFPNFSFSDLIKSDEFQKELRKNISGEYFVEAIKLMPQNAQKIFRKIFGDPNADYTDVNPGDYNGETVDVGAFAAKMEELKEISGAAEQISEIAEPSNVARRAGAAEKLSKIIDAAALLGGDTVDVDGAFSPASALRKGAGLGKVLQFVRAFDGELATGELDNAGESVQKVGHTLKLLKEFVGANDQISEIVEPQKPADENTRKAGHTLQLLKEFVGANDQINEAVELQKPGADESAKKVKHTLNLLKEFVGANDQINEAVELQKPGADESTKKVKHTLQLLKEFVGANDQISEIAELKKPGAGLGKILNLQRTLDGVASSPAKLGKGLLLQRYFDGELGAGQMSDAVENVQKVRHTLQLMKEFADANDQINEVVQIMTAREKTVEAIREYARELYAERGAEAANISGLKLTMMARKAAKEHGWDTSEIAPGDYAQIILDEINKILSEGASGSGSSGSSFGEAFTAGLADGIRSSARVVEDAVREIVNALRVQIAVPLPTIRYSPVPVSVSGGSSGVNFGSAPYVGSASDVGSAIAAALARSGALNADVYIDGVKVGYQTAKPVQYANNQRAAQSVAARGKSEVSVW